MEGVRHQHDDSWRLISFICNNHLRYLARDKATFANKHFILYKRFFPRIVRHHGLRMNNLAVQQDRKNITDLGAVRAVPKKAFQFALDHDDVVEGLREFGEEQGWL